MRYNPAIPGFTISSVEADRVKLAEFEDYDTFKVSSWVLEDYYTAVTNPLLFEAVVKKLDASFDTELLGKSREEAQITLEQQQKLVEAKYHCRRLL